MAQRIPTPELCLATHVIRDERTRQGELFARLPRQLPIYKHGPEDDAAPRPETIH